MEYVSLYPHLYGYSMNKHIITEISPLSEKDCLFIVERYKTEFTYPLHNHKEYEPEFRREWSRSKADCRRFGRRDRRL